MFTIVKKRLLAPNIYLMEVNAPRVAKSAQPGQFVIVRVREKGERIPLTIADFNRQDGAVTIVTQSIGASTKLICALQEGEALLDFAGPLGQPSELIHMTDEELANTRILFIGGGVGTWIVCVVECHLVRVVLEVLTESRTHRRCGRFTSESAGR